MNFVQFLLFAVYVSSMLVAGMSVYSFADPSPKEGKNRFVRLGESLLLGAVIIVGEMMLFSLFRLYTGVALWSVVFLNFSALLFSSFRRSIAELFFRKITWDLGLFSFIFLVAVFLFRNCYFLADVDSHSTYLFAQKLWLENHTSLIGSSAVDMRIFVPQFNTVPYALGLSIFPSETLFPQLVVAFWTVIVVLLVFGYVSAKMSRWHGLAAAILVLFNDHIFYSGANQFVLINSALIAFLFASVYNFWESRNGNNPFRFLLGSVFLLQTLANKYQILYAAIFIFLFAGIVARKHFIRNLKWIFSNHKSQAVLAGAVFFFSLPLIKNFIITGIPTFPIFAGSFKVFNWTPEMADIFNKVHTGPLSLPMFLKYMSYLFVWPGIHAMKIVFVTVAFLPIILVLVAGQKKAFEENDLQFFYWLAASILITMGLCLVNFFDPRTYRYGIAVLAVTVIFSIDYILRTVFNIKNKFFIIFIILIISLPGYKIIYCPGAMYKIPTFEDNIKVLQNKIHFSDVALRHYPYSDIVRKAVKENPEKFAKAAWNTGVGGRYPLSAFLSPTAPQVGLWHMTVVRWDSYKDPEKIVSDLRNNHIEWIMQMSSDKKELLFLPIEQYAQEASRYDRFPDKISYDYGFPEELTRIH